MVPLQPVVPSQQTTFGGKWPTSRCPCEDWGCGTHLHSAQPLSGQDGLIACRPRKKNNLWWLSNWQCIRTASVRSPQRLVDASSPQPVSRHGWQHGSSTSWEEQLINNSLWPHLSLQSSAVLLCHTHVSRLHMCRFDPQPLFARSIAASIK